VRHTVAAGLVFVSLAHEARAGVQPEIITAATFVSGPAAPGAEVDTLAGSADLGGAWNPTLRLGVTGSVKADLGDKSCASARWGVFHDQAWCDTCDEDRDVGWWGSEVLGSTDLDLRASTGLALYSDTVLRVGAIGVLPASRHAFVCNPFYGSPGVSAAWVQPASASTVTVGTSLQRPLYRYDAVPVGQCSPPLNGSATVASAAGPVTPTPWEGEGQFAFQNPALLWSSSATWSDPLALLPGVSDQWSSSLSAGVEVERDRLSDAVVVETLAGPVTVPASREPPRVGLPWSLAVGWSFTDHTGLVFSLSNRVPAVLASPGSTLRVMPATTAMSLGFVARP